MSQVFEFISSEASPVLLADAKLYMKITSDEDNKLIENLINTATDYAEQYTGRAFRVQTWKLYLDLFTARIPICKNVQTITSVDYTVASVLTLVASSVYYIKKGTQGVELLLDIDQDWPTDGDEIEQGIVIEFKTNVFGRNPYRFTTGLLRHISYMYSNRGDCDDEESAKKSGALDVYKQYRIARV